MTRMSQSLLMPRQIKFWTCSIVHANCNDEDDQNPLISIKKSIDKTTVKQKSKNVAYILIFESFLH